MSNNQGTSLHYKKLPTKSYYLYGFEDIGHNLCYMVVIGYMMYFCSEVNLMNTAIIGTVSLVSKIWDAVNDIMIGNWCNRTHAKIGRFKPWIFAGIIPTMVLYVLMFTKLPDSWSETAKTVYICVLFCTWTFTFSMIYIGYGGLSTVMTIDVKERGKLQAFRIGLGQISSVALSYILTYVAWLGQGDDGLGWFRFVLICAIAGGIIIFVCAWPQQEVVKLPDEKKVKGGAWKAIVGFFKVNGKDSQYWIVMASVFAYGLMLMGRSSVYAYYFTYVADDATANGTYNLIFYLILIIGALMAPMISQKWFKHKGKTEIFASGLMAVCYLIQGLMPYKEYPVLFMILAGVSGWAIGIFNSIAFAATNDLVEWSHYTHNVRNEGLMASSISFWMKLGMGVGTFLTGVVLAAYGYSGALDVQPDSAVACINFIMTYFGTIIAVIMMVVFIPYKLSEKKIDEITAELDNAGKITHIMEKVD